MLNTANNTLNEIAGQTLENQTIDQWAINSKMNYEIRKTELHGTNGKFPQVGFYRSDNNKPLAINSKNYKIVQPREVLGFFNKITQASGWQLESAGALHGGKRYFALAKNEAIADLGDNDYLKPYLLLATACDGSMSTIATFTSIRMFCFNQMPMIQKENQSTMIKISHRSNFDAGLIQSQLGLNMDQFNNHAADVSSLVTKKMKLDSGIDLVKKLYPSKDEKKPTTTYRKIIAKWFHGDSIANSGDRTAFDLYNCITEYIDHEAPARTAENRLNNAYFGNGKNKKAEAFEMLLEA